MTRPFPLFFAAIPLGAALLVAVAYFVPTPRKAYAPAPRSVSHAAADPLLTPPPGTFTLLVPSRGLFSVVSNGASRAAVLRRLAQLADVQLVVAPADLRALERSRLRLRLASSSLEQVLPQLTAGSAYAVEYTYNAELRRHHPTVIRVGQRQLAELADAAAPSAADQRPPASDAPAASTSH